MKTLKLSSFMRHVYRKNKDKRRPIRAMMELTYKCNHKCIHCYNPEAGGKSEMSKEETFSVIDQLADLGTLHISFTGGEIFTRPDIMDIVNYAKRRAIRVSLMTNGSLITDEIADDLISIGISDFEISLLGATKETCDKITGVGGSFDKVVSALKMLRQKGIIPHIKTCVTNINLDEVDKIADLAKEMDVSFSCSPCIIPRLDLRREPLQFNIEPVEFLDINKRFERFRNNKPLKKAGFKKPIKNLQNNEQPGFWERECLFNCMAGHTMAFINPYGEMKACMTLPEPSFDIRRYGAQECWEKIKQFVDTLKAPTGWGCFGCEYRDWCSWCPGRGYLNTGDAFGCPPYQKELAKVRKERYEMSRKSS